MENLEREEQLLFSSIDLYQTAFTNFTLPDGSATNLSAEKFRTPEVLFDPHSSVPDLETGITQISE